MDSKNAAVAVADCGHKLDAGGSVCWCGFCKSFVDRKTRKHMRPGKPFIAGANRDWPFPDRALAAFRLGETIDSWKDQIMCRWAISFLLDLEQRGGKLSEGGFIIGLSDPSEDDKKKATMFRPILNALWIERKRQS